jgi:Ca2+-binding RTX toxin-like protein
MRNDVRSPRRIGALALATGVATAAPLLAATPAHAAGADWAFVVNNILYVQTGTGAVNTIYLHSGPGTFNVEETAQLITLDRTRAARCVQSNPHLIVCPSSLHHVDFALNDGNDFLDNQSSTAVAVDGGPGDDTLWGGAAGDLLEGAAGKDTVHGRGGPDGVYGGDGDDTLYGEEANDTLRGGPGKDTLYGGLNDDNLEGDDGRDTLYGQEDRDTLTSADRDDDLWGGSGNDTLEDSRTVHGDDDNDVVNVRYGATGELWGGTEYDVVSYRSWPVEIHVSMNAEWDDGDRHADCDDWFGCPVTYKHNLRGDFERIDGTDYDDKITGDNADGDVIYGWGGNDRLYGRGGNDVLDAGAGGAQLTDGGGGDADVCRGTGITRKNCER